ncbi:apolipoprotein D [Hyalella azteca]|uniref:Apolipoprotein D n=1 Tax=Hyalella azteca TaxID=294128 RepID=A0A8B7N6F2_HYAAZ|nr:apolipoprotein D [Hyalella azteca]
MRSAMGKWMWIAATLHLMTSWALAQVHYREPCPNMPVIKNFDFDRYLGRWYEQERFFTAYQNIGYCWSGTYIKDKYSNKVSVRLDFEDILLRIPAKIFVDIFRKNAYAAPNRLSYSISGVPREIFVDHYEVSGTDYTSWTIEYSCQNMPFGSLRYAWILTRSPHPPASVIKKAKAVMVALGIDVYLLERHKNTCVPKY